MRSVTAYSGPACTRHLGRYYRAAGGGAFEIRWCTIDGGGGFWPGGTVAAPYPADLDGSGAVDFADLLAILAGRSR